MTREVTTSLHALGTADGAGVTGVLRVPEGATTVTTLMHPRQDFTHHPLVPGLLAHGVAVWTQGARSVNDDIALVHEQALLDFAAGQRFLRDRGFSSVVTVGHSGGAALSAFYHQQAGLAAGERLATTPAGRETGFARAEMPLPDGVVFVAPHPGQGHLLMRLIDPSVTDEADPLARDPELDPYSTVNGFADPPGKTVYDLEFVARYRAAQRDRVARLDAIALERVGQAAAARRRWMDTRNAEHRRVADAPRLLTVYRTDADLRSVDLTIDPNDRPYGSLFKQRPDLSNFGLPGFGRITTPDAWLSTWSGLSTNASMIGCAPGVTVPALLIELTGDQACFPADIREMADAMGSRELTVARVEGTHFGGPITPGRPSGIQLATKEISAWLEKFFPAV
ncbi:alpha/beta hydrolase [Amycolatopsis sp. NPDC048633]|uniref:alpha/beta hydrolase n=1 Tax=Amycolatopsis sp. NPDC048633 TaxID=3157095 RepID=UPI0033DFB7AF